MDRFFSKAAVTLGVALAFAGSAVAQNSEDDRPVEEDGKIARSTESYTKWAREAAIQEGASFIDLNEIIAQEYEKLGPEKVEPLFADKGIHTSVEGAQLNARCVVAGLKGLLGKPFDPYLSAEGKKIPAFEAKN